MAQRALKSNSESETAKIGEILCWRNLWVLIFSPSQTTVLNNFLTQTHIEQIHSKISLRKMCESSLELRYTMLLWLLIVLDIGLGKVAFNFQEPCSSKWELQHQPKEKERFYGFFVARRNLFELITYKNMQENVQI